jgi:predicted amino acid racemase
VNPITKRQGKARRRCRKGTKSVNAACVTPLAIVQVPIRKELQDELSFARDYLVELPHRIREVQEAADAVLRVGRGR